MYMLLREQCPSTHDSVLREQLGGIKGWFAQGLKAPYQYGQIICMAFKTSTCIPPPLDSALCLDFIQLSKLQRFHFEGSQRSKADSFPGRYGPLLNDLTMATHFVNIRLISRWTKNLLQPKYMYVCVCEQTCANQQQFRSPLAPKVLTSLVIMGQKNNILLHAGVGRICDKYWKVQF